MDAQRPLHREFKQGMFWNRARLPDVAGELANMVLAPGPAPSEWNDRRKAFASLLAKSTQGEKDQALSVLTEALRRAGAERVGAGAVLVGALVEDGADPIQGGAAILGRLRSTLDAAPPDEPAAVMSVRALCAAALACLRRSKELRKQVGSRELIKGSVKRFEKALPEAAFLLDLLSVLDDERLVVLQAEPRLGFEVRISGIADNFQLHTLLCGALVRPGQAGFIDGTPPNPDVLAAAHGDPLSKKLVETASFNLVGWDGTWIWNEGTPADIPALEGVRVVRLESLPYRRSWSAGSKFPGMPADAEFVRPLRDEETVEWLTKMRPTKSPTGGSHG